MLKKEIISLTEDLIRIDSSEGDGKVAIIKMVKDFYKKERVFCRTYNFNNQPSIVISTKLGKKFDLILSGHLDVVWADKKMFKPICKNNKIYGRGAGDMKGPDVSMMLALRDLSRLDRDISIALILTTDEEIGGENGTKKLLEKIGYSGRFAVVPDGGVSLKKIILKKKGILQIKVVAQGVSAHGSRPFFGENAIDKIIKQYQQIRRLIPEIKERKWKKTMNLGCISGGRIVNMVPDYAEMSLDIRYTNEMEREKILKKIKELKINFSIINEGRVFLQKKTHPFVKLYQEVSTKILGSDVDFGVMEGSSDARFFAAAGIPTIITRPDAQNIHGSGEYVEIQALIDFYKIVKELSLSLNQLK